MVYWKEWWMLFERYFELKIPFVLLILLIFCLNTVYAADTDNDEWDDKVDN